MTRRFDSRLRIKNEETQDNRKIKNLLLFN